MGSARQPRASDDERGAFSHHAKGVGEFPARALPPSGNRSRFLPRLLSAPRPCLPRHRARCPAAFPESPVPHGSFCYHAQSCSRSLSSTLWSLTRKPRRFVETAHGLRHQRPAPPFGAALAAGDPRPYHPGRRSFFSRRSLHSEESRQTAPGGRYCLDQRRVASIARSPPALKASRRSAGMASSLPVFASGSPGRIRCMRCTGKHGQPKRHGRATGARYRGAWRATGREFWISGRRILVQVRVMPRRPKKTLDDVRPKRRSSRPHQ